MRRRRAPSRCRRHRRRLGLSRDRRRGRVRLVGADASHPGEQAFIASAAAAAAARPRRRRGGGRKGALSVPLSVPTTTPRPLPSSPLVPHRAEADDEEQNAEDDVLWADRDPAAVEKGRGREGAAAAARAAAAPCDAVVVCSAARRRRRRHRERAHLLSRPRDYCLRDYGRVEFIQVRRSVVFFYFGGVERGIGGARESTERERERKGTEKEARSSDRRPLVGLLAGNRCFRGARDSGSHSTI